MTHDEKIALEIFGRELAPAGTGMAPGLTTLVGGRPKASPVLRLHTFLIPKSIVPVSPILSTPSFISDVFFLQKLFFFRFK